LANIFAVRPGSQGASRGLPSARRDNCSSAPPPSLTRLSLRSTVRYPSCASPQGTPMRVGSVHSVWCWPRTSPILSISPNSEVAPTQSVPRSIRQAPAGPDWRPA